MPRIAQMRKFRVNTDILYEEMFPISSYRQSARLRRIFDNAHHTTVYKMTRGKVSPVSGEIVRLEVCCNSGSKLCSSVEAYRRFMERMNGVIPNNDPDAQTDQYFKAMRVTRPRMGEWTGSERKASKGDT